MLRSLVGSEMCIRDSPCTASSERYHLDCSYRTQELSFFETMLPCHDRPPIPSEGGVFDNVFLQYFATLFRDSSVIPLVYSMPSEIYIIVPWRSSHASPTVPLHTTWSWVLPTSLIDYPMYVRVKLKLHCRGSRARRHLVSRTNPPHLHHGEYGLKCIPERH